MARIVGINLPAHEQIWIGLQRIFGIGKFRALQICNTLDINYQLKVGDISDNDLDRIRNVVNNYVIEGDLRREISMNIKHLIDLKCYRGMRHIKGLPVRGQRTKTNARTRKGAKRLSAKFK